jgi:hypothetical protein
MSTRPIPWPELDQALKGRNIELGFAELKDPVKDQLRRFGLLAQFGERCFYPPIEAAIGSYLNDHAVGWADGPQPGRYAG